jgi:hypothetical protein
MYNIFFLFQVIDEGLPNEKYLYIETKCDTLDMIRIIYNLVPNFSPKHVKDSKYLTNLWFEFVGHFSQFQLQIWAVLTESKLKIFGHTVDKVDEI